MVFHARSLTLGRKNAPAIIDLSLSVEPGTCVALTGDVTDLGAALAAVLTGNQRPADGEAELAGHRIAPRGRSNRKALRRQVGILRDAAQAPLNPTLPIGDAIAEPLRLLCSRLPQAERDARMATALGSAGPSLDLDLPPHVLSPRGRQQTALARALVTAPGLVLAIAPFAGLDPTDRAWLMNRLMDLPQTGVLLVEPDILLAAHPATRLGVIRAGRMVEYGAAEEITLIPRHPYTELLLNTRPTVDGGNLIYPRRPGPRPAAGEQVLRLTAPREV